MKFQRQFKKFRYYKIIWQIFVLLMSFTFLWLALRGISWIDFKNTLFNFSPLFLILFFFISSLALIIRSYRWGLLLRNKTKISWINIFFCNAIGYLGNTILPSRAGELIRTFLIVNKNNFSPSYVIATVITEKVIDAFYLVILGSFLAPAMGILPKWVENTFYVAGSLSILILGFLFFTSKKGISMIAVFNIVKIPEYWRNKISIWIGQFQDGSNSFFNPKRASFFLFLTFVIWYIDAIGTSFIGLAIGLKISILESFFFLILLGLSSAIPSTPGNIGIYQFISISILPLFGFTKSQSLVLIIMSQIINILNVTFWGFFGMIKFGLKFSDLNKKTEISS